MKIRDIKYKEIADDNKDSVVITVEKDNIVEPKISKKDNNEIINNNEVIAIAVADKLNQYHNGKSVYFRIESDDELTFDSQENKQILKEEIKDSENNYSYYGCSKKNANVHEFKSQDDLDSEEIINFKKSLNKSSILKNFSKKGCINRSEIITRNSNNISNNKSAETEDKNQNDEEYNKIIFSQASEADENIK